jgi:hypothetical protein
LTADELRLPMYKPGRRRQGEPPCSSSTNDSSPPLPGQLVGLDLVNPLLCREKRNAEAVRMCRVRYQDAAERAPQRPRWAAERIPWSHGRATTLRGWMNE